MAYEQRDNSGSSFKNKKEKDTHADYAGKIMVEGKLYWINTWIKTSSKTGDDGKPIKFLSHSIRPVVSKGETKGEPEPKRNDPPVDSGWDL